MKTIIPYDQWLPLTIKEVLTIFDNAPFQWALAGGYAVEQFLGRSIRAHSDIDVIVYRDQQLSLQRWLDGWLLYAADPPGTLRAWLAGEYLPVGIHDIWGHKTESEAWQLQIMLAEVEGQEWVSRRASFIRGTRESLIATYNGVPCVRIDVQLLYKAKNQRPKDNLDFEACLPLMNQEARQWLKENLGRLYPQGHHWLNDL